METAMKRLHLAAALAAGIGLMAPVHAAKLTIWLVGDDKAPSVLKPAVEAFQRKHPGTEFDVRAVPWGDAMTKYSAAIASKSGPDIVTGGLSYGIELGAKGGLVDIGKKAPDLVAQMNKTANKGILKAISKGDAMYAVPYDLTVQLQFYRTDLMAKAPTTWAEFAGEVEKLQKGGAKGFAQQWGNMGWLGFFPYLYQAGGAIYDAQCSKALINSDEAVTALKYYAQIYTKFKAPTDSWPDIETGLETGSYPLAQSGAWIFTSLDVSRKKIEGKWSVAKLPAGPTGKSTAFIGGTTIGVTNFSSQQELAIDFLRTLYEDEVAKQMMNAAFKQGIQWLPGGRQDLIEHAALPAQRKEALLAQLQDAEGPPNCKGWEKTDDAVTRAIQQVVLNGADPKQALNTAAEKLDKALRK